MNGRNTCHAWICLSKTEIVRVRQASTRQFDIAHLGNLCMPNKNFASAKLCTSRRTLSTSELCWNNQWFLWGTRRGSGWSAGLAGCLLAYWFEIKEGQWFFKICRWRCNFDATRGGISEKCNIRGDVRFSSTSGDWPVKKQSADPKAQ